jgi:hypothetical protein
LLLLALLVGTTLCVAASPQPAVAGTYSVWYCVNGSGNPVGGGDRDWDAVISGAPQPYVPADCGTEPFGVIERTVETNPSNSPEVTNDAQLLAPSTVSLSQLKLWWHGLVNDGSQVAAIALTDGSVPAGGVYEGQILADHRTGFGSADPLVSPPLTYDLPASTSGLLLRAACPYGNDCQVSTFAQFTAYRVGLVVSDARPPQGTATGGLLTDAVLTGTPSVTVDANDVGSGVYLARILVDGRTEASTQVGGILCRDVDTGNADAFEFSTVTPCPLHEAVTMTLDTSLVADDAYHRVEVQVIDAAGNTTTVADRTVGVPRSPRPGFFDPVTRGFLNPLFSLSFPRALNGRGAASGAVVRVYLPVRDTVRVKRGATKGHRRRVTRARSRRTVHFTSRPTLRARLTDVTRRPIVGAKVWIATRVNRGEWQISGRPHTTGRTGRIGLKLEGRTPSRDVNVVYFPFSDSHEQAVGRPVRLDVRAGVRLRVDHHRARNGGRIVFTGQVAGPLASSGAAISLQVKIGRRYRTFRTIRVTPAHNGRFRTAYRFSRTLSRARYHFRVLVPRQAGLPYENGTSDVESVLVTP